MPKSICQTITNPNCKHIKAAQKTFVQKVARKILVKLTPGGSMVPNMFCDFYLGKNSKIANNQQPQKLEKKNWKPNNFIFF